jgi:hypothetical protein
MNRSCRIGSLALVTGLLIAAGRPVRAQNPDLMLTREQRDSILATYDNIFPIWGRKAIKRGFDLPRPFGINLIGAYVDQGIEIGGLGLSTGDNPTVPISAITFGDNQSAIGTLNLRGDLWVLPFINVYGMVGLAQANTTVEVTNPVPFTSSVDQTGRYLGIGLTGSFGIKRNFAVVDVNWAWSDLEKLDDPVRSRVLSMRLGRAIKLSGTKRLSVWAGTMNVKFKTETQGSLLLSEAVPPETVDRIRGQLESIDTTQWYQDLSTIQQVVVDTVVSHLLSGDAGNTTVNYYLDKAPSTPWNMLLGANLDLNRRWSIRSEVGFIGRASALLNLVYRLDL